MKAKFKIGTVLALTTSTCALAANYAWDGANSSDWRLQGAGIPPANNWDTVGYPGKNQAGDVVTIADASPNPVVALSGSLAFSVSTVALDASTADGDLEFDINSGTSATFSTISMLGGSSSGGTVADDAKLKVAGFTSLSITNLVFDGDASSSLGRAIGDFDESFTVSNDVSISAGYADIDNAANKTLTVSGDLLLAGGAFLTITGGSSSAFAVADDVVLDADTNNAPVTLRLSSSSLSAADVYVYADEAAMSANSATLDIESGAASFAPGTLTFDGGVAATAPAAAFIDIAVSVGSNNGALNILDGVTDIDMARGVTMTVGVFTVDDDADFGFTASGSSGTAVISCTSYVQDGGAAGSLASVGSNAQIVTR